MARLAALEQNDFAPIRSLLNANYGNGWKGAIITAVEGGQNHSYKIQNNGSEFYLKLATPGSDARIGMPEGFAHYLSQQGVPAVHFEKMKDGRIVKILPKDVTALQQIIPDISNPVIARNLSGAVLTLSQAIRGTPLPFPHKDARLDNRSIGDIGRIAGQIARNTEGFLSSYHLTLADVPPAKNDRGKTGEQLLGMLHLNAFGTFDEVHHQLHEKGSPASLHMREHAQLMRDNAVLMEKMAATHPQGDLLRKNAKTLAQFANRYENGLALELIHYTNQITQMRPRLQARETTVCHGDFWHDNILSENGSISGIIDFDQMQRGDKLQDLVHYLSPMAFDPFLIQKELKGYEEGNGTKLSQEDLALLPYLKLQDRISQVPKDLEFAFSKGFPKDVMVRKLSEADIAAASHLEPIEPRVMMGTFDDLKPYIHADYNAILNQPQFDTSLFRKAGRIHAEGANALFDYIGAVFSPHDFAPENASRLKEKINTVVDIEERLKLFTAANPSRKEYTIDEVVQAYPNVNIPDNIRADRSAALTIEIRSKLDKLPKGFNDYEDQMERQLASLPADMQKWLYLKGTEFTFTAGTVKDENGHEYYKGNEDMFPNHPSVAHMKKGGGNFLTYRPDDKNAITYAYTSMQRNPMVLLAHEAIGHALYNEARQRNPAAAHIVTGEAAKAAMADIGDINKTKAANPSPNNGRLGVLKQAVDASQDDESLWNALQKISGSELPALQGDARSQWLKDVRALTQDTFKKLGPDGWMHNVQMYADRNLFVDEIIAATAEQIFVSGKGKESAMRFVLPALTGFFSTRLLGEMNQFIAEKEGVSSQATAKTEVLQASEVEAKLREETMRRELIEESQRLNNFSTMSMGVAVVAVAGTAIALFTGTWMVAAGCAVLSGAGLFGSSQWGKEAKDKISAISHFKKYPRNSDSGVELIDGSLEKTQDKWQQRMLNNPVMERAM